MSWGNPQQKSWDISATAVCHSLSSLIVQWLRLRASNAGGAGSIPGLGTKPLSCVAWPKKLKDNKYLLFLMICLSSNYAVVKMLTFPSKGKEKILYFNHITF